MSDNCKQVKHCYCLVTETRYEQNWFVTFEVKALHSYRDSSRYSSKSLNYRAICFEQGSCNGRAVIVFSNANGLTWARMAKSCSPSLTTRKYKALQWSLIPYSAVLRQLHEETCIWRLLLRKKLSDVAQMF